jgi:hypothetical protein
MALPGANGESYRDPHNGNDGGGERTMATSVMTDDQLSAAQCRQLLASSRFGRIAVCMGGLPAIVPVRYTVDGSAILVTIDGPPRLHEAVDGHVIALQVDAVDPASGRGWSVHAIGVAAASSVVPSGRRVMRLVPEVLAGTDLAL